MLAGIIEHRRQFRLAVRELDDFFERLALQIGVLLDEAVQRRDIGLMVLAVMQLQGLLAHANAGQGRSGIGKGGEFESHMAVSNDLFRGVD